MSIIDVNCERPRLRAGDAPRGNCFEHLALMDCAPIDMCAFCIQAYMASLDMLARRDLPWHADYRTAAGSAPRPRIRDRAASRFAELGRTWYRLTGGTA